jgi:hypothetical protein
MNTQVMWDVMLCRGTKRSRRLQPQDHADQKHPDLFTLWVTQIKKSRRLHPQHHADKKYPDVFTLRVTQIKKIQTSSPSGSRRLKRFRCLHAQGHADQKDPDVFTLRFTQIKKILLMLMTVCCDKQSCAGDQKTQLLIRNVEFRNLPHLSDNNVHLFRFLHLLRRV